MRLTDEQKMKLRKVLEAADQYHGKFSALRRSISASLKIKYPAGGGQQYLWAWCWSLAANQEPYRSILAKGGLPEFAIDDSALPAPLTPAVAEPPEPPEWNDPIESGPLGLDELPPGDYEPPDQSARVHVPAASIELPKEWEIEYEKEDDAGAPDQQMRAVEILNWVVSNLRVPNLARRDAPNRIAWVLLWYARNSREGLEKMVARWLGTVSTKDGADGTKYEDDGRKVLSIVLAQLQEHQDAKEQPVVG